MAKKSASSRHAGGQTQSFPVSTAIRGVILDLDGTVYNGAKEVPGAAEFVNWLVEAGVRYVFVTNRANRPAQAIVAQLRGYGMRCDPEQVLTSAEATALSLRPGKAFLIGESGLREALQARGFVFCKDEADYVIVGYDTGFTYAKLARAMALILRGARFIATNPDKRLKTESGFLPGTGAIVAGLMAATGIKPRVIGKPGKTLLRLALRRMGLTASETLLVGDNVETDIPAGARVGMRTALFLGGVSTRDDVRRARIRPTWIVRRYGELRRLVRALATP